jgi:phytoene desaturase
LFLGAKPSDTPSFYSFMNFADFGLGTWHPKNGMYSVILAMETIGKRIGVFKSNKCQCRKDYIVENKKASWHHC